MEREFRGSHKFNSPDEGSPLWDLNKRLLASFQARDFWEARRLLVESNRASMAADLVDVAPKLPINYTYLKPIAGALRVPAPSPHDPASLMRFLLAVPELGRFDMRFNAFLEGESLIDAIPAICIYEQLLAVLKGFIDLVVPAIMSRRTSSSVDPARELLAEARGNRWLFRRSCKGVLNSLFCESDHALTFAPWMLLSRQSHSRVLLHLATVSGAQDFVYYHELGHLLMGHLAKGPSQRVEFEADQFARLVVGNTHTANEGAYGWRVVGAVIPLVLLAVLDVKAGNFSGSSTHPPSRERVLAFARSFKEPNASLILAYARGIAAVCNPALERWWNCRVTL